MDENGVIVLTDEIVKECVQTKKAVFDKSGDSHYKMLGTKYYIKDDTCFE